MSNFDDSVSNIARDPAGSTSIVGDGVFLVLVDDVYFVKFVFDVV